MSNSGIVNKANLMMMSDPIGDLNRERRRNAAHLKLSKSVLSSHGGSSTGQNSDKKNKVSNAALQSSAQRLVNSAMGQYRSLQVSRKNSEPFETNSSGGYVNKTGTGREDGSLGRTVSPTPASRLRAPTFSSSQKKRTMAPNRSLIIQPQPTGGNNLSLLASDSSKNYLLQTSSGNIRQMGVKKKKTVVKKVVRKRMVSTLTNQAGINIT